MKNQWLARKTTVVNWEDIGLSDTYGEKLEALYVIMINRKNAVGGQLIFMGAIIYDLFVYLKPHVLKNQWIVKTEDGHNEDIIRIVFSTRTDKLARVHSDIWVRGIPEQASDS